jgi:hypothetical protein
MFLFLLATASGQTISPLPAPVNADEVRATVKRLLQSDVRKDQAWGAWLTGRQGLEEFIPSLYGLLYIKAGNIQGEEWDVIRAALDSLIQLDAEVPSEILMPLSGRFSNEVIFEL